MAPIAVDGLGVDDVTIDGDVVDEITMDGDVVYQAITIPDSVVSQYLITDSDDSSTIFDEEAENNLSNDGLTFQSDVGAESGRYLNCDGDSGAYEIPGSDFKNMNELTVTFWIRSSSSQEFRTHIIGHGNEEASTSTDQTSWMIAVDEDINEIGFFTASQGGGYSDPRATFAIEDVLDDSWNFVAYRFDNGSLKAWLNTSTTTDSAHDSSIDDSGDEFMIAGPSNRDRRQYEGDLDDIKFFNSALTDDEINQVRQNHPRA